MLAASLSQCAAPPSKPVATQDASRMHVAPWEQHRKALTALTSWETTGRLAASNGKEGGSAAFNWRQQATHYHIKFMGAFGAGTAIITGGPQHVVLQDSQGKMHEAETPEVLMNHLAGWHIPVSGLQHWVKGIPIPGLPVEALEVDAAGNLIHLTQLGWHIDYSGYHKETVIALPSKVSLVNNNLKVKLVMKQWHI